MIEDGFRVIDRGHGPDDRVVSHDRYRAGQDPRGIAAARTGLAAYGLGLAISQGGDTDRLFALADLSSDIQVDPGKVAPTDLIPKPPIDVSPYATAHAFATSDGLITPFQ